jgi:hypothetical protein
MANYLNTQLFFWDRTLARRSAFSREEIRALLDGHRPCFRASSRNGFSADCVAAMLAAQGSDRSHLDFIASKGDWPHALWAAVLPFEDLATIAESIDSLLAWSAHSIPRVTRILDYDSAEAIEEALKAPEVCANPNEAWCADQDGYGARFIFSFLASIASVARDAHTSQRALICLRGSG